MIPAKPLIYAALVAAVIGGGLWLRHSIISAERARIEADRAQTTIEALKQSQKDRTDAKDLDDDGLVDALSRWLLPAP